MVRKRRIRQADGLSTMTEKILGLESDGHFLLEPSVFFLLPFPGPKSCSKLESVGKNNKPMTSMRV